jgi:hypothetical protein
MDIDELQSWRHHRDVVQREGLLACTGPRLRGLCRASKSGNDEAVGTPVGAMWTPVEAKNFFF